MRYIQELLDYESSKTTEIYTHVAMCIRQQKQYKEKGEEFAILLRYHTLTSYNQQATIGFRKEGNIPEIFND